MLETLLSEKRAGGKMLVKLTPVHFKHEYPVWMYELQPEQHNNLILWAASFCTWNFLNFFTPCLEQLWKVQQLQLELCYEILVKMLVNKQQHLYVFYF